MAEASDSLDEPVGAALARWRKGRKVSGQVLGKRVGMSQAKISRLETGVSAPEPGDVRLIAEGLELPTDEVERLVTLAERSGDQLIDWHAVEPNLPNRQHFVRRLEAPAREVRTFQPAVVVGLLQTSEYARAVLTALRNQLDDEQIAESEFAISEAVAARMQRSQVLYDPSRRFHFVMAESVLANRVCAPTNMLAQIARVREVAGLANVSIRIVPEAAEWPVAPFHGFEIMGDRHVLADLFNSTVSSRSRSTVRQYRGIFDSFESIATADIDSILDKYQKRYINMLPGVAA